MLIYVVLVGRSNFIMRAIYDSKHSEIMFIISETMRIQIKQLQKYSMENMNIFYPLPGIDLGHLCFQVERVPHWAMPPSDVFRMFWIINCPHYKIWSTHQDHVNQQILMYSFPKTWVRKKIIFLTNISKRPGDDKLFSMNLNQNENKNKKIEYWVFTFLTSHAVPLKYLKLL